MEYNIAALDCYGRCIYRTPAMHGDAMSDLLVLQSSKKLASLGMIRCVIDIPCPNIDTTVFAKTEIVRK